MIDMAKNKSTRQDLTPEQLEKFRDVLMAKKAEIVGDVARMEDGTLRKQDTNLSHIPSHLADASSDSYETDNTLELMQREKVIVRQINNALRRIEEGTYGICQGNGERIPQARLEAIPWAQYCVSCAERAEKELRNRGLTSNHAQLGYHRIDDRFGDE